MFTDSPLISRIWRSLTGRVQYSHTAQEHRDMHRARRFDRAYRGI